MYVRLAFGVAAHLEPEILIVDEVLAVGDAEFQKKALGKMKDVSEKDGRTVLFVSHNMEAIQNLCERGILLSNGKIVFTGNIKQTIDRYLILGKSLFEIQDIEKMRNRKGNGKVIFTSFFIENEMGIRVLNINTGDTIKLCFGLKVKDRTIQKIDLGFSLHNKYDEMQAYLYSGFQQVYFGHENDELIVKCQLTNVSFGVGSLLVRGRILADGNEADWPSEVIGLLNIENGDYFLTGKTTDIIAPFMIKGKWELNKN